MFDSDTITHPIERSILTFLTTHENARFRDLRPSGVETNLFSYHLKLLQKSDFVTKTDEGYTLGRQGLIYVDQAGDETVHPKIITMLLVQDGYGKVLLQRRNSQPFINTWTLPYGKLRIDDTSVIDAARRVSREKLLFDPHKLRHVGDCYITVMGSRQVRPGDIQGELEENETLLLSAKLVPVIEMRSLAHIVRFETDAIMATDDIEWVDPLDLPQHSLAPAVEQIVTRAFFGDDFFFEEFGAQ